MRKLSAVVISLALAAGAAPALLSASADSPIETAASVTDGVVGPQKAMRVRQTSRLLGRRSGVLVHKIRHHQRATWHWQELMGKPRTRASLRVRAIRTKAYRTWLLHVWRSRH